MRKFAVAILVSALYVGGASLSVAVAPKIVAAAPLPPSPFEAWLDRLVEAESNHSGNSHLKILDLNGKYSYGCLQFQAGTFLTYGKIFKLIPQNLTFANVEPLIYNCALQEELATKMIEENYSNWRAWYSSVKKVIGLPPASATTTVQVAVAEKS